jgi:condensin complex subunit 3
LKLTETVLEKALSAGCHGQERKSLLGLLAKLYIPPPAVTASPSKESELLELAGRVKELLDEAISDGIATDAAGRNTLVKIKNAVLKIVKGACRTDRRSAVCRGATIELGSEGELNGESDENNEAAKEQNVLGSDEEDEAYREPEGEATQVLEKTEIDEDDNDL